MFGQSCSFLYLGWYFHYFSHIDLLAVREHVELKLNKYVKTTAAHQSKVGSSCFVLERMRRFVILHFQKQQVGERHHQQQMSADAAEAKVKGIPFGFIDCLVQACDECHQIAG